ncbi:MAG: diaminopimelate epimerase, partial [Bacteroidia bacterium]|nr:diaminopimelate epimerase [Bacteroidia bacterium]
MAVKLRFSKYQATGNDFVVADNRNAILPRRSPEAIRKLCHRRMGVGADGLILLFAKAGCDFEMVYYNSDGREATFCGNGARCAAKFAAQIGAVKKTARFWAADGEHLALIADQSVRVSMNRPKNFAAYPDGFFVDTGSPHFVVFVEDADTLDALNVAERGEILRHDVRWARYGGANVDFVGELDTETLFVRTYERGVEAETLSCGTGVAAAAYVRLRRDGRIGENLAVRVRTSGGLLTVHFGPEEQIELEGPAVHVFDGEYLFQPD